MVHLSQCLWRSDSRGSLLLAEVFAFKIIGSSLEIYKTKILSSEIAAKLLSSKIEAKMSPIKTLKPAFLRNHTKHFSNETFLSRVDRMTANMAGRFSLNPFFNLLEILLAGFHQTCCRVCPTRILPYFPLSLCPSVRP